MRVVVFQNFHVGTLEFDDIPKACHDSWNKHIHLVVDADVANRVVHDKLIAERPRILFAPSLVFLFKRNATIEKPAQFKHCRFHLGEPDRVPKGFCKFRTKFLSIEVLGNTLLIQDFEQATYNALRIQLFKVRCAIRQLDC